MFGINSQVGNDNIDNDRFGRIYDLCKIKILIEGGLLAPLTVNYGLIP